MKTIAGYTDKISIEPGGTIAFKVSCESGPLEYRAQLVRLICNDAHPEGPGLIELPVSSPINQLYRGRKQDIYLGSYVLIDRGLAIDSLTGFTVQAMIWPTTPGRGTQTLISTWSPEAPTGFLLQLDNSGALALVLRADNANTVSVSTNVPLLPREWAMVVASYDVVSGRATLIQRPLREYPWTRHSASVTSCLLPGLSTNGTGPLLIAAHRLGWQRELPLTQGHYNGKIDGPRLSNRPLTIAETETLWEPTIPSALDASLVGAWDFSRDIGSVP
jgi:hypothetical protein